MEDAVNQTAEAISEEEKQRILSILSFWHKLEFFIPADIDHRIAEAGEQSVRRLFRKDLERGSSNLWRFEIKSDEEIEAFHLYLGVFDKAEIISVCRQVLGTGVDLDSDEDFHVCAEWSCNEQVDGIVVASLDLLLRRRRCGCYRRRWRRGLRVSRRAAEAAKA